MKDVLTFVGIDVSKARLDVASHPTGATHSVANDANGIKTLVEQLRAVKPLLVVLEATGGIDFGTACVDQSPTPNHRNADG
jgi:transposase